MRHPWQVWTLFTTCVVFAVAGMSWLTAKALELDCAEATARAQAEQEEAIGRALWRMDARVTPWLAEEAARPSRMYQPFYKETLAGNDEQENPSPLLLETTEIARLHFQVAQSGKLTSPQCPTGADLERAKPWNLAPEALSANEKCLSELKGIIQYETLVSCTPATGLKSLAEQETLVANQPAQVASNNFDLAQRPQVSRNPGQSFDNDLNNRNSVLQSSAKRQVGQQGVGNYISANNPLPFTEREGASQTTWVGTELFIVRRVETAGETMIQGCWLDWPKIRQLLIEEVADLLPACSLEPVVNPTDAQPGRVLATLPVQLSVAAPAVVIGSFSPIRISLLATWGALFLATAAVTLLLQGVLTLSERRAAFVSAVTHELRTPLTTFRMYAEMLASGMVTEEAQQKTYLDTLQTEANRLSHLVENVLQYARLERGRPANRRETIAASELLARFRPRLQERCEQAGLQLVVGETNGSPVEPTLHTDPAAVEQILFNLIDNACKYAATATDRRIQVEVAAAGRDAVIAIRDHGPGISAAASKKLFRPFSKTDHEAAHSAPGVGLGLALCRRLAEELGGTLTLESPADGGARFLLKIPAVA